MREKDFKGTGAARESVFKRTCILREKDFEFRFEAEIEVLFHMQRKVPQAVGTV